MRVLIYLMTLSMVGCGYASVLEEDAKQDIVAAVSDPANVSDDSSEGKLYSVVAELFVGDKDNKIYARYPQIQGLGDKEREDAINELIRSEFYRLNIEEQLKHVQQSWEYGVEDYYYLKMDYDVMMQTDKLLSILYTEEGRFKTSFALCYSVQGITIDLERVEKLALTDFVTVDKRLLQRMRESEKVTNHFIDRDGKVDSSLLASVRENLDMSEDWLLEVLSGSLDGGGGYTYAVSPEALHISVSISHAGGDYLLFELPFEQ